LPVPGKIILATCLSALTLTLHSQAQVVVAFNLPSSSSFAASPNDTLFQAQTFTPSATDQLLSVSLAFFTSSPQTPITLRLNNADPVTGLPGSTTLATVTLSPDQVTYSNFSNPLYTTFDFYAADITLTAGTPYSLILTTPSPNFAYFVLTSPDAYTGGKAFQSEDTGVTFTPLKNQNLDWAFAVAEVPECQWMGCSAMLSLMLARPRRRPVRAPQAASSLL
jgi:hypothetical protein